MGCYFTIVSIRFPPSLCRRKSRVRGVPARGRRKPPHLSLQGTQHTQSLRPITKFQHNFCVQSKCNAVLASNQNATQYLRPIKMQHSFCVNPNVTRHTYSACIPEFTVRNRVTRHQRSNPGMSYHTHIFSYTQQGVDPVFYPHNVACLTFVSLISLSSLDCSVLP